MHASPSWLCLAAAVVVAVVALAIPSRAAAGEFTIQACQADAGDFASTAFEDFATRGMKWRRACNPLGPEPRGLVTSNVVRSGRVAHGAQSAFVMNAPPDTTFSRLRWSGHIQRRDCRYTLQLYAERPDGSDATIKNVRANERCPLGDAAQASSWPRPRAYELGGASRIIQRVACVGASSARFCSARGLNYIQTFTAEATVVDYSAPSVAIIPSGPLARGEWVSGTQDLDYEAADNVASRGRKYGLGTRIGVAIRRNATTRTVFPAQTALDKSQSMPSTPPKALSHCMSQPSTLPVTAANRPRSWSISITPRPVPWQSDSKAAKPGETAMTSTLLGKTPPNLIERQLALPITQSVRWAVANARAAISPVSPSHDSEA
jgi:hypothetical protein